MYDSFVGMILVHCYSFPLNEMCIMSEYIFDE